MGCQLNQHSETVLLLSLPVYKLSAIQFPGRASAEAAQRTALRFLLLGYGLDVVRFPGGASAEAAQRGRTMLPTTSAQSGLPSFIRRAIGGISTEKLHCVCCFRCAGQPLPGIARLAPVPATMSAGRSDPAPIRHKSCIETTQYYSLLNIAVVYSKISPLHIS